MAFRSQQAVKKVIKKLGGEENLTAGAKESLKKWIPESKIVMGRAQRGLYAGRHIQYGNNVSEDGGNKTKRHWKPNVQDKRLFSYVMDKHIKVKVTTHALRCIDKAGGIDEYLLKTPYQKMDTEAGLFWKTKIEKLYEERGDTEELSFSRDEGKIYEREYKDRRSTERAARRDARREMARLSLKKEQIAEGTNADAAEGTTADGEGTTDDELVAYS